MANLVVGVALLLMASIFDPGSPKAAIIFGALGATILVWVVAVAMIRSVPLDSDPVTTASDVRKPDEGRQPSGSSSPGPAIPGGDGSSPAAASGAAVDGTHLPEEALRSRIGHALMDHEIDQAIAMVKGIVPGSMREEECGHVLSFCVSNDYLEEATDLATACFEGQRLKEELEKIALERLKNPKRR
ncbi:MAG TPA: hypothetical protein VI485_06345 [Vicinamibacterales bacterium]|nr:hypothetical protein [Vicinamibacterales bacterium]